ncbi:C-3 sterol dehydrogenase/C-4 decarboxylase-like protein [Delitschia confertaspora ATCC 74209]|uniref:C-3 sterol dehydrogenase/C-4 decarboxylase-like protein n=1 Tax=Delitschia confertaspora ATCC 74209 TaxID=1513339 RepID=A0A9P4MSG9_9PLEO|nr:C-3 sterol dehydrogenase/C-4 decarboxylase-like protein [Delitschia confertaspora ATCC 74209]
MGRPTILVTGGTGFLGSEIVKALVETNDYKVIALDINPPSLGTKTYPHVTYIRANILQPSELTKMFQETKPTIIVHSAGLVPAGNARYNCTKEERERVLEVNVSGTRNVVEAAKEVGVRGLVYTSSFTVVTDDLEEDFRNVNESAPTGRAGLVYGQSKTAAEELVLSSNTPSFHTVALRPSVIFGPADPTCIPVLHSCIPFTTPFIIGTGTNLADFIYVSNCADAHVLAVRNLLTAGTAAGEAFFISNGEPVAFRDFCVAVWKEFGHVPPVQVRIPKSLAWGLGAVAEWVSWVVGGTTTLSRGSVKDATAVRYVSMQKARRVLGYQPRVGLSEGVKITCEHFKRRYGSRPMASSGEFGC